MNQKKKLVINLGIVFFVCFIPQCFVALMQYPILVSDDLGVVSSAAYLAGRNWPDIWKMVSFYGGGYHILMTPIFMLTSNPLVIYRVILCSYVFLESLIAIIAYYILIRYYQCDSKYASVVGIVCSYFTFAKPTYVSNEIVLLFGLWIIVLFVYKLVEYKDNKKKKIIYSVAMSLVSCYLLTIHLRSTALLIAIIGMGTIYMLTERKNLYLPLVVGVLIVLGYWGANKFNEIIQSTIWISDGALHNSNVFSGAENITKLFNVEYWHAWAAIFFGQLATIAVMSVGVLCPIFIVIVRSMWRRIIKNERSENFDFPIVFLLVFSIIITLGGQSVTWLEHGYNSMQFGEFNVVDDPNINFARVFTYLRYFSLYTNPLMMIGLARLQKKPYTIFKHGILLWGGLQVFWLKAVFPYICNLNSVASVYVPFAGGKYGNGEAGAQVYLPAVLICTVLLFIFCYLFQKQKSTIAVAFLCACVVYQFMYYGLVHENDWWNRGDSTYEILIDYVDEMPFEEIYVPYVAMAYEFQFLFNDKVIINSLPDDEVEEAVVFSNLYPIDGVSYWKNLEGKGYKRFKIDNNEYVYVKGEEYEEWFLEKLLNVE